MKKTNTRLIVMMVLAITLATLAQAQPSQSNYIIPAYHARVQYETAITALERGDFVSAYGSLLSYFYTTDNAGHLNQYPQFRQQVLNQLNELGTYVSQAVRERDTLLNDLRECQQACQDANITRGSSSVTKKTPTNQLPRIPPLR